jgi:hypothetical protein
MPLGLGSIANICSGFVWVIAVPHTCPPLLPFGVSGCGDLSAVMQASQLGGAAAPLIPMPPCLLVGWGWSPCHRFRTRCIGLASTQRLIVSCAA